MKIVSILGCRPNFIKESALSPELRKKHIEVLVHTGQHYDKELSQVFFDELGIPAPDWNLSIGSGEQGEQTGQAIIKIEKVLLKEKPDLVIVYGDVNSSLAGALAACKLHIPVCHVEAGCRSFDKRMSEEYNRILIDHVSTYLFCVNQIDADNLENEGITENVHIIGDVMFDALMKHIEHADKTSRILNRLNLKSKEYNLVTIHRAENVNEENLRIIFDALISSKEKFVIPLHPRTKNALIKFGLFKRIKSTKNLILTEPLGYLDFIKLERHARKIISDSGGIQKEAYYLKVPCIVLRRSTEWVKLLSFNKIVEISKEKILSALNEPIKMPANDNLLNDGKAAERIANILRCLTL